MRLTDVISSYKDLLPEPSTQYAEIIRLNEPDFRPSVESFDLAAALADPPRLLYCIRSTPSGFLADLISKVLPRFRS